MAAAALIKKVAIYMPSNGDAAAHSLLLIYAAGSDPIESAAAALHNGNCARPKKERSRRRVPLYVAKHLPIYASVGGFAPFLRLRGVCGNENGAASLAQGLQNAMARRIRRGSLILWTSTSALSAMLPMTRTFFLDRQNGVWCNGTVTQRTSVPVRVPGGGGRAGAADRIPAYTAAGARRALMAPPAPRRQPTGQGTAAMLQTEIPAAGSKLASCLLVYPYD